MGKTDRDAPPKHQAESTPAGSNDDRGNQGRGTEDTEHNQDHDMENRAKSGLSKPDLHEKSTAEIFNDQLKEIDQAINYIPSGDQITEQILGQRYEDSNITHGAKVSGASNSSNEPVIQSMSKTIG
jgi:hypothetical protein